MKKIIALALAAMLVFALAACGQDKTEEAKDNAEAFSSELGENRTGGYTDAESLAITDEIRAMVAKANETLAGAQYEPVAYLASQVVAGTNHLILCKVTPTVPDAVSTYAIVTFYEDLSGNVEITDVQESEAQAPYVPDEEGFTGGWSETDLAVTDEAKAALQKACEELDGANYEAVALLATQLVAGTNYSLLCRITPVVPNPESHYAIVTVYADLNGGAEITETFDFGAAADAADGDAPSASSQAE